MWLAAGARMRVRWEWFRNSGNVGCWLAQRYEGDESDLGIAAGARMCKHFSRSPFLSQTALAPRAHPQSHIVFQIKTMKANQNFKHKWNQDCTCTTAAPTVSYTCSIVVQIQTLKANQNFEPWLIPPKQARKLQATLEGCNPKLWPTDWLTDGSKV